MVAQAHARVEEGIVSPNELTQILLELGEAEAALAQTEADLRYLLGQGREAQGRRRGR